MADCLPQVHLPEDILGPDVVDYEFVRQVLDVLGVDDPHFLGICRHGVELVGHILGAHLPGVLGQAQILFRLLLGLRQLLLALGLHVSTIIQKNTKSLQIIIFLIALRLLVLLVAQPLRPDSVLPDALADDLLLPVSASPVLLPVLPLALVNSPVLEGENTESMLFVIFVGPVVFPTVRPDEDALTVHFVVVPLALVNSAVLPDVFSKTVDIILKELAFIGAVIAPDEGALALLLAALVAALVEGPILPLLLAVAFLLVVLPVPHVLGPIVGYVFACIK